MGSQNREKIAESKIVESDRRLVEEIKQHDLDKKQMTRDLLTQDYSRQIQRKINIDQKFVD